MRAAISLAPDVYGPDQLGLVTKYLLRYRDASEAAERAEQQHHGDRVARILKSIAVGQTGDAAFGSVLSDWQIASDAFFAALAPQSVFFNILGNGIRRVPLATRLGALLTVVTAQIVGEGNPTPVSSMSLTGLTVPAKKAVAIIVTSEEVARTETQGANALVSSALRDGIGVTVDQAFFDIVMVGATSIASSGTSAASINDDLRDLLNAVNTTGAGRLLWAMAPDVANSLTLLDILGEMTPTGGRFKGVAAVVSGGIPSGTLRLLNASGFAGDAGAVELSTAYQADVDFGSPVDSPPGASTQLTSLWQNNLAAVKALCLFGVQKIRTDAIAELTGITWGNSP